MIKSLRGSKNNQQFIEKKSFNTNETALVICGIAIEREGKFLLIQQRIGEFHGGKWAFPGGRVKREESLLETAIREAKEETGLDVELNGSCIGVSIN